MLLLYSSLVESLLLSVSVSRAWVQPELPANTDRLSNHNSLLRLSESAARNNKLMFLVRAMAC